MIREAICRAGVEPASIGDVIMGCVLQGGAGMNVARQAAIKAGVPKDVPCETVNRVCGSGLQAVVHAVEAMQAGYIDLAVAGGTESMSGAPYLPERRSLGLSHGPRGSVRLDSRRRAHVRDRGLSHGRHRRERSSNGLAFRAPIRTRSPLRVRRRAEQAIANGSFKNEIVAVEIAKKKGESTRFETDEHPRRGTTVQTLAGLKPAFKKDGSVTAGNASGINDGAAALVVASEARARQLGRTPLAKVISFACTGVDPAIMGMGPVTAVRKAIERAGLSSKDIDLFELNEAFAAQALAVARELSLDPAKVNTRGGAIALGHPIGASGARILTTLIHALRARGGGKGIASLCIGGGMGIAMVVSV